MAAREFVSLGSGSMRTRVAECATAEIFGPSAKYTTTLLEPARIAITFLLQWVGYLLSLLQYEEFPVDLYA